MNSDNSKHAPADDESLGQVGNLNQNANQVYDQFSATGKSTEGEKHSQDQYFDHKSTDDSSDVFEKAITAEKSIGVEKAEILANQWKHSFWYKVILGLSGITIGWAWGLDSQTRYMYSSFASSSWSKHSLITTLNCITGISAAATNPVVSRLSDIIGRMELLVVSILFYVVGTIIEGQSPNIHAYVAGNVLYSIGFSSLLMVVLLIMSDFSSLRWRMFFTLAPSFGFIVNTWISGTVINEVGLNWKWGISMWAFIIPLASIPLFLCLIHMRWLAGKTEEWKLFKQRKTKFQELGIWGFTKYLFWRLDLIGLILLVVCLGCLLAPLTLANGTSGSQWAKAHIIIPLCFGGALIPGFVVWEIYGARDPIFPFDIMKDRGAWSAIVISFLFDFVFAVEYSLLNVVLVVGVGQSLQSATRIANLPSFVAVITGLLFGLFVVYFRRLKPFVLLGCVLWLVAFGMLYHYRSSLEAKAGIIGAMVVNGIGNGLFSYELGVSIMSVVSHERMAVALSSLYVAYRVGYSVGSSVAGAIWTNRLPAKLEYYTGNSTLANEIFSSPYTFVAEYPWGTPQRMAAVHAYADTQRILMIVCLCFVAPMIFFAFFLRDPELTREQSLENNEAINDEKSMFDIFRRKQKKDVVIA
ncbi:unnamed protein product [Candida verbasci]|uniref:Major facilitator superfamily (MFS) profile domain-containing protein n=1 Tax=Candida verbasci TaxID=1227364 RepID=A0A9W4XGU5_9ASCO|nr:unnamed protein product [Candida verbasci]